MNIKKSCVNLMSKQNFIMNPLLSLNESHLNVNLFIMIPFTDDRHLLPNYDTTALFYGSYAYQYDRESAVRNYG